MRKAVSRLLIGTGAVFAFASPANAQPVEVGHGQLPFEYLGRKLVPIHRHDDSLFVIVAGEEGACVYLKSLFDGWNLLSSFVGGGFEDAEFKVSRSGLPFVYNRWMNNLYFFDGFQFRDRSCPGRPIIDNHGNIHVFSDNSIYYYSTDTLASFDIIDTVNISAEFVYLVSSPDDSIVGALFFDEQNDSLYKYLSYNGGPISFTSPSEVLAGDYGITWAFDIVLDYSGTVYYVVNQDLAGCPPWAWGCYYAWAEDFGYKYLGESFDDAVDGTNFELSFSYTPGEVAALRSGLPMWGWGTRFFATTDEGETWYSCSYYFGEYSYYGSAMRNYGDSLMFVYFAYDDADESHVYYMPIPRDSIFAHLVSVDGEEVALPADIHLSNHPNPFNSRTTISFKLPTEADIALKVFDVTGDIVATLYKGHADAGLHSLNWDGTNSSGQPVSSGVYFYRLSINGKDSVTKRMLLLK